MKYVFTFSAEKEVAQAHLSLHLSVFCHIVGNLMSCQKCVRIAHTLKFSNHNTCFDNVCMCVHF